ncbi:MAG: HEAT repeat domain-containing protein [Aphanocapsa sp. GSE-SYN-MK-11-07L]|jgi:HEAT repeat protein|nr:HEAT repeat domain-containing protein [Aphanocapsa sp. GSE-SYN-MK-11-07L]
MDSDRLAQLESLLRSGSLDQCKLALDDLAQTPSDLAVPILQRLSENPDFLRRRFAVMGLGNHQTPESLTILKDLLAKEQDSNVIAEVANSLFEFGNLAIPLLEQLFYRDRNWLTRQTILAILTEANQDQVLLAVIKEALIDETQTVKETAILALGGLLDRRYHEEALELLTSLAQAPDWRDRWRAATALRRSADPKARQVLADLQTDQNHYVVAAALEGSL